MADSPGQVTTEELQDLWTYLHKVGTFCADANWLQQSEKPGSPIVGVFSWFKGKLSELRGPGASSLVPLVNRIFSWKLEAPRKGMTARGRQEGRLVRTLEHVDELRPWMPQADGAIEALTSQLEKGFDSPPGPVTPSPR